MGKLEDKALICRQCGKEFTLTQSEQEFYIQRGFSQPSHCPGCRSGNRKREPHLVCSSCGSELGGNGSAYCSTCVDNLKLEAEFKLQKEKEKVEELERRLENQGEMEASIASMTAEVEKSRQTKKELQSRVQALELENSKLAAEMASWHALGVSVDLLRGQLETFQQSYVRDVEKFLETLLEIQSVLTQRRNGSLLQRIRLALVGRSDRRSNAPGDLGRPYTGGGEIERSEIVLDSDEEPATSESETSEAGL